MLTTAHLGDVWLAAYQGQTFTAPKRPAALNSFSPVTLTGTSGGARPLGDWTHFQRAMTGTGTGTSSGQAGITPSALGWDGDSFSLTVE